MRTQIVFTCTRCGKEQTETLNRFTVRKFTYKNLIQRTWDNSKYENELCPDCYRSLQIWLRNGDEYKVLIDENKHLKEQVDWLNNNRITLRGELDSCKKEMTICKEFCPKESKDWEEYQKWWKEKHKDDFEVIV